MDAILTSSLGRTVLDNSVVTIGRASDNTLVVSDPTVSAHHAEIRPDRPGYSLVDLGSTNGTFVNMVRLARDLPHKLRSGDICYVGNFTFTYEEEYLSPWEDSTNVVTGKLTPGDNDLKSIPPSQGASIERDREESGTMYSYDPAGPPFALPSPPANLPGAAPSAPPPRDEPQTLAPPPTFGFGAGGSSSPETRGQLKEYLQFTTFHPGVVPVETWNTLLVYAYIQSALQAIRADAYSFKAQLGSDRFQVDALAVHPLARGEQITIVPTFEGVTFNPERMTFAWTADWHRAFFSFNAERRWAGAVGSGEILVFSGPLIIASFKISLRFGGQSVQGKMNVEEVQAQRYRKIFTSYSHDDTPIVLAIRKAYQVLGDESFLDIEHLRSGQIWNAGLLRMIDTADIFQLFWSVRSAQSAYVRQEYQYALQHYKYDGFIRPVYWEKPLRPPPEELASLHFAYYELPRANKKNALLSRLSSMFTRK